MSKSTMGKRDGVFFIYYKQEPTLSDIYYMHTLHTFKMLIHIIFTRVWWDRNYIYSDLWMNET